MKFTYLDKAEAPFKIIYPADFEQWVYDTIPTNLMYNRFKRVAQCIRCGNTWVMDIDEKYHAGELSLCPYCMKEEVARPHTSEWGNWGSYFWMWNADGGINFAAAEAWWRYNKQPIGEIDTEVIVQTEYCGRVAPGECFDAELYSRYGGNEWWKKLSMFLPSEFYKSRFESHASTQAVVNESFLKHCMIDTKCTSALIKEMAFFAKHPAAEYIRKAGLDELVHNTVWGIPSHIRPNWNAKSIPGILRLSHQEVDKLKAWNMFKIDDIAIYLMIRKYKRKPTKEDIELIRKSEFDIYKLRPFMKHGVAPLKFIKYIHKQYEVEKQRREEEEKKKPEKPMCHAGYYYKPPSVEYTVNREYEDYLDLIDKLEYPHDDYYLYPKDLKGAHDAAAAVHAAKLKQEAAEKNKKWNREFKKTVLKELENYTYEDDEYIIRPLRSKEEFTDEGIKNHNCVASYAERAKAGKTKIFVLRQKERPDTSYVTIELSPDNKEIRQCYETGNRIPPAEVDKWVKTWLTEIVQTRQKKISKVTANEGRNQILCPAM